MTTSRRKFIKISALGLGGVVASASALNVFGKNSYLNEIVAQNIVKNLKKTATYCEVCFWKCAAWFLPMKTMRLKKLLVMMMTHIAMVAYVQEELEV
ncbi:hypothetical protein [Thalassobellus suaedae]|uniref:Uncharacterized protein n=1 Tax=Thalassobellus suaedae TaxID=3074124 RepID=A0ABY9XXZ0_9FLAO|nr:hypothetical protein RHP51_09200 [Flavobacteriaceae bacterium HL-DH14]